MAAKKTLRSVSQPERVPPGLPDPEPWSPSAVEPGAPAPVPLLPRTASVDACAARSRPAPAAMSRQRPRQRPSGPEPAPDGSPAQAARLVTMRWSDVEELHLMLNALEKERKRLEEKLSQVADILEENSMLRATVELLERERRGKP